MMKSLPRSYRKFISARLSRSDRHLPPPPGGECVLSLASKLREVGCSQTRKPGRKRRSERGGPHKIKCVCGSLTFTGEVGLSAPVTL